MIPIKYTYDFKESDREVLHERLGSPGIQADLN